MSLPSAQRRQPRTPLELDNALAASPQSEWSWRLERLKLSEDSERAVIHGTVTKESLRACSERIQRALRPADLSDILKALSALAICTRRREETDPAALMEAYRLYAEALTRFPADVALWAINTWPETSSGDWWPTLHELTERARRAAEWRYSAAAAVQRAEASAPRADDGAGPTPSGATERFYQRVAAARGPGYAFSWLNRRNCRFTGDTVFATEIGAQRLLRDVGAIARECGVSILVGARFADDGEHADAQPAPVWAIEPEDAPISDEERAAGAALGRELVALLRAGGK